MKNSEIKNFEYKFEIDRCDAYLNGDYAGGVEFMDKEEAEMGNVLVIQYAEIKEKYRGIGLYKEILTFASNNMEEDYILSDKRSEDATNFYKKYCDIEDFEESVYQAGDQEEIKIYEGFELDV